MKTKKVAVIADVHANMYALEAFLAYLDTTDITEVWNLGDFLQIGPHPAEVADLLLLDSCVITILGNNEQALMHRDPSGFPVDEIAHQDWTIAQLGEERLSRIRQLPSTLRLTVAGRQVLLTHEQPTVDENTSHVDLICCGHTHQPSYERHGTVGIMNPGSLGFTTGHTSASFGIIELSEASVNVRYHAIPFKGSTLKQDYQQRQVPGCERIFSIFLSGEGER